TRFFDGHTDVCSSIHPLCDLISDTRARAHIVLLLGLCGSHPRVRAGTGLLPVRSGGIGSDRWILDLEGPVGVGLEEQLCAFTRYPEAHGTILRIGPAIAGCPVGGAEVIRHPFQHDRLRPWPRPGARLPEHLSALASHDLSHVVLLLSLCGTHLRDQAWGPTCPV